MTTRRHPPAPEAGARTARTIVVAAAIAGLASACSGATTSVGLPPLPAASAVGSAPAGAVAAAPSPTPTTAPCDDLASTAAGIRETIEDLSLLVGTQRDATSVLDRIADFAPSLGGLVPACEPAAEDSMWRFLTAAEELRQRFTSGGGATGGGANRLALIEVRARAADLYERLGLDGYDWDDVPEGARPVCRDLDVIGARMTWDVRHLTNLVGSDNATDAAGYFVDIGGLTSALGNLVADCRPKADAAMVRFTVAVDNVTAAYRPGADPAVVATDKDALRDLREAGISLYTRLRLNTDAWEVIPLNAR